MLTEMYVQGTLLRKVRVGVGGSHPILKGFLRISSAGTEQCSGGGGGGRSSPANTSAEQLCCFLLLASLR